MEENGNAKHSVIVTIVSRGYADIVIEAAKDAGARGGTVIYARGSGVHEAEKFIGITIQPEKEVVLTLVKKELVKGIVSAITERAGLATEGRGISFVLPVTRTAGLTDKGDKEGKEAKEGKPEKEGKDGKDGKDGKEGKPEKEGKEGKANREGNG